MMSSRNKTIGLEESEIRALTPELLNLSHPSEVNAIQDRIIHQDMLEAAPFLPSCFVDLLFLDPPYNLNKTFNGTSFKKRQSDEYKKILESWIKAILHTLKPTASIYICSDWHTSTSVHDIVGNYFTVRNRITWEREKGRGALSNWKNCSEDIWFCTMSDDYHFDADAVKLKKKVIAPYRHNDGTAKDWEEGGDGNYRLTSPSNLWTDMTVPFWSMPENTEHPTQKPEKLAAKIILASTKPGDMVLDPFLGSGTTAVTAKKLGRHYVGIEQEPKYCCLALKRLDMAQGSTTIQGYSDGVFWERNTLADQKKQTGRNSRQKLPQEEQPALDFLEPLA